MSINKLETFATFSYGSYTLIQTSIINSKYVNIGNTFTSPQTSLEIPANEMENLNLDINRK